MVQAVPKRHTIVGKLEGRWEVRTQQLLLLRGAAQQEKPFFTVATLHVMWRACV
jgi:hypothetical protein